MVPILGTTFGSNFGYHFWSPGWEQFAFVFLQVFVTLGTPPRTVRRPPTRTAMANKQPTHRAVSTSVASHSAGHWVVMGSSSGYQKCFPCWSNSVAHCVVSCACLGAKK